MNVATQNGGKMIVTAGVTKSERVKFLTLTPTGVVIESNSISGVVVESSNSIFEKIRCRANPSANELTLSMRDMLHMGTRTSYPNRTVLT